jgi:LmbE family N-acetylglucosaminyl deacetylase
MKHARAIKWGRRLGIGLAAAGAALVGAYNYQPIRFEISPPPLPSSNPWTDPDSGKLFNRGARVAIITAHPDDAEFYIGGFLTRLGQCGADMTLIVATDGDKGYYPLEDAARNREVRQGEQRKAARAWHAHDVIFLGYADGRLQASPAVGTRMAECLQHIRPDYVVAFDGIYHPRVAHRVHTNSGLDAAVAIKDAGFHGWLMRFNSRAPNFAVDVTPEWQAKMQLIAIHRSQFFGRRLAMAQRMLTRSARAAGQRIGVTYAEAFRCEKM